MTITSRTKRVGVLTICALAAVVGPLAAAPAQAQTVSRSPAEGNALVLKQGTEKMSSASSASTCDAIVSRGTEIGLCGVMFFDGGNPYRWPVTELDTDLGQTSNRVWFHQNEDGSGWSQCYSGNSFYLIAPDRQDPGNIFISDNTALCPG